MVRENPKKRKFTKGKHKAYIYSHDSPQNNSTVQKYKIRNPWVGNLTDVKTQKKIKW
jgi:replication-associated recombination protein RarA